MIAKRRRPRWLVGAGLIAMAGAALLVLPRTPAAAAAGTELAALLAAQGKNPHPVHLVRPRAAPLSAMAQLGRAIFFDPTLSSSGRMSCASCHDPAHAYASPSDGPVMLGGPDLTRQGIRAVPSLMYLERQPSFSIGPDKDEDETTGLAQELAASHGAKRTQKTAAQPAAAANNLVPQGGLFWDGRADTLQDQALAPVLDPREMDGGSIAIVAGKLRHAPYADRFIQLFGLGIFDDPRVAVSEALFAVGRFQIEDPSFHPYASKFDRWLEGKASFAPDELRGYLLFNDPEKGNCAGCHLDRPTRDGLPPLFTDHQFEALGVPRNRALAATRDPASFDLGLCGPRRTDRAAQPQYCGFFATPSLRNVATRHAFFHNGVYTSLRQVLEFYRFRDTEPANIYPRASDGAVQKYDDLPARYGANVDTLDPPFGGKPGETPVLTDRDLDDIVAFLGTLTDRPVP